MTADGGDINAQGSVAPPFLVPQRHDTSPTIHTTPSLGYLHPPLRGVRSDSALSSHSRPASPVGESEPIVTVTVVSDTNRKLRETLVYPEGEIPVSQDCR